MSRRPWQILERLAPSCREVMRLFSRSLDEPPGRGDRLRVAVHLLHCPSCRRATRQISLLSAALRRLRRGGGDGPSPRLPGAIRERIVRALREK